VMASHGPHDYVISFRDSRYRASLRMIHTHTDESGRSLYHDTCASLSFIYNVKRLANFTIDQYLEDLSSLQKDS